MIPELTDSVRLCGTCTEWCPTSAYSMAYCGSILTLFLFLSIVWILFFVIDARSGFTCDVFSPLLPLSPREAMVGLVLRAHGSMKKRSIATTSALLLPLKLTTEGLNLMHRHRVVGDALVKTNLLLRNKKTDLSNILICGHSVISGRLSDISRRPAF